MNIQNVEDLLQRLQRSESILIPETTKRNILKKFQGLDDVITTDFIKISLLCPLSKRRIEVPVRYGAGTILILLTPN